MEKKTIVKIILVATGTVLIAGADAYAGPKVRKEYWAIRNTNLNTLGPRQRVKFHKQMTKILISLGSREKKPDFNGGSKFSYNQMLNDLSNSVIPFAFADHSNEYCLFGGWPSVRSGRCNTPYSSSGVAAAGEIGTAQYDSNYYCNSKSLFRCNPLVFGPGLDSSLAGEGYENINGYGDNSSRYNAGICVDISSGFNGLSKKCQDASDHLDSVRRENNMKPWRESDFFNEDRANEFKALQGVIADRCEANRENINSDGMCDSLEKSLSLTATAAKAGTLNGINIEQIMPHCVQPTSDTDADRTCQKSDDASLANLYAAIEELKGMDNCKYGGVQAVDSATGTIEAFEPSSCALSIEGELASGFSSEQEVSIMLKDKSGGFAGSLKVMISPDMSKEQILEKFMADSQFKGACAQSGGQSCNHPKEGSKGASVVAALNEINNHTYEEKYRLKGRTKRRQVKCGFDSVEIGVASGEDQEVSVTDGSPESATSSHCGVQFTGELQEKLESDNFRNQGVSTTVKIVKGGKVLSIPLSLDSASVSTVASSLKSTKGFEEFCKGEAGPTAEELAQKEKDAAQSVESMREKFGLSADQHLTTQQREALVLLQDVEGLSVEIDQFGGMTFNHDDISSVSDRLEALFPGIHINRSTGKSARLFPEPEVRVEFLAARSGTELTAEEKAMLTGIEGTTVDNSVEFFSGLTRDAEGNLVFLTNGAAPLSLERKMALERRLDGKVIEAHQEESDPSVIRSYVIRAPATVTVTNTNTEIPEEAVTEVRDLRSEFADATTSGLNRVRNQSAVTEENFKVTAGAPELTEDGKVSVTYSLDVDLRRGVVLRTINLFLTDIRGQLRREGCEISPRNAQRIVDQGGKYSIVCPK